MKMTLQCRLCRAIYHPFLDAHARLSYRLFKYMYVQEAWVRIREDTSRFVRRPLTRSLLIHVLFSLITVRISGRLHVFFYVTLFRVFFSLEILRNADSGFDRLRYTLFRHEFTRSLGS